MTLPKKELQTYLMFYNNCGHWEIVGIGKHDEMRDELFRRSKMFNDRWRYRLRMEHNLN